MTLGNPPAPARRGWRARLGSPAAVFGLLAGFSVLFFLALLAAPRVDGQLIGSDGVGYYVYVRSLVLDRDLDFANEYRAYDLSAPLAAPTATGHVPNKYAIGPSLLWLPFFLAAHLLALLGLGGAADGFGHLYQAAISLGSIAYGALGFGLAWDSARRLVNSAAGLWAVGLLWLGSNAFYYMVFEPSMSHMTSLFAVALLLWTWHTFFITAANPPQARHAALLGAAGGLVMLVRLQDAPFLAVPFGFMLLRLGQALRRGDRAGARRWLGLGLLAGLLTALVFLPQLLAWKTIYGRWTSPYLADHDPAFYWTNPQIGGVLFSTFHGLFSWHPLYLIALIGLIGLARRERWLALALLALLAVQVYVVAAWWSWWQGDSFGGRMFLNAMWIWVIGLAVAVEWARARPRRWAAGITLGVLLVGWNALALVQYRLGFVPMSARLTWEQMTIDRLKLPWTLAQRFLR